MKETRNKKIDILDPKMAHARHGDILFLALLMNDRFSALPDLYEVFGKELFLEFFLMFSGQTITVPSLEEFEKTTFKIRVYQYYKTCKSKPRTCAKFDIGVELLDVIIKSMKQFLKKTRFDEK